MCHIWEIPIDKIKICWSKGGSLAHSPHENSFSQQTTLLEWTMFVVVTAYWR